MQEKSVYLIEQVWHYEGNTVVAVVATREEADRIAGFLREKQAADEIDVSEWQVGDVQLPAYLRDDWRTVDAR